MDLDYICIQNAVVQKAWDLQYVRHDQTRCCQNYPKSFCRRSHSIRSGSIKCLMTWATGPNPKVLHSQPNPSLAIQCPTYRVSIQKYCTFWPALWAWFHGKWLSEFVSLVNFCKYLEVWLIHVDSKISPEVIFMVIFPFMVILWLLVQSHLFHQLHRIGQVWIRMAMPGRGGPPEVRQRRGVFAGPWWGPELLLEDPEGIGALDATHGIVGHTWDLMGDGIWNICGKSNDNNTIIWVGGNPISE